MMSEARLQWAPLPNHPGLIQAGTNNEASWPNALRRRLGIIAMISIRWTGNGIARLTMATKKLSGPQEVKVINRALNHVGDKTFTIVLRTLADQIGASQRVIKKYGAVSRKRSTWGSLTYVIKASGGPIPVKHFRSYQSRAGVTAAPWKRRRLYTSAFIVRSLGGHAFWNNHGWNEKQKRNNAITRIAGPNVPKELVKDHVAAAFETTISTQLPKRVEHEIKQLTNGVLS